MSAQAPQQPGLKTQYGSAGRFARQVNQQVPRPGRDTTHTTLPGGVVTQPLRKFQTTLTPFLIANGFIHPGTYNSIPPTVDGDALTEKRELAIGTGERHVYLKLTYTLTASDSGYVYSATLVTAQIIVEPSLRIDPTGPSASVFWVLIASFDDQVKTSQYINSSLSGHLCDSGQSDDTANLNTSET